MMSFYTSQKSTIRSNSEVQKAMKMFLKATNKASAQAMSQKTGVKYGELRPLSICQNLPDIHGNSLIFVEPRIDSFARCEVNGFTFSSTHNRTDRGQTTLVYCVKTLDHSKSKKEISEENGYPERVPLFYQTKRERLRSHGTTL